MAGLPGELNREIHTALLATRFFDTPDRVRSLFVDDRLFQWQNYVPGGDTSAGHVTALVDFLYGKNEGEGLLALLQVVQEALPEDSTRRELARVAGRLAAHLQNPQLDDDPPFLGMPAYQEQDAHRFFGRERVTAEILAVLQDQPFLCVVGASGSGKSSVVRAGVVPAVRQGALASGQTHSDAWPLDVITPGEAPLKRLAAALSRHLPSVLATQQLQQDMAADTASLDLFLQRECPAGTRFFLVVDQFEELYTGDAVSEDERRLFVGNLLQAVSQGDMLTLVFTLRADFYSFVLDETAFAPFLPERQYNLGPMSAAELRRAMTGPLLETPWRFRPGLVASILGDLGVIGEEGRPEPGALPLLSHALLETWRRREGNELTLAGYQAVGGIEGAIAQTAEQVYTQALVAGQQPWAEHIFLRLVALGEGTQDTSRRATLDELLAGAEKDEARAVLQALADARLVVTEEEGVQVAHEALIRNWPRLRTWLDANRGDLRLYRRLAADAQEWEVAIHSGEEVIEEDYLYRGGRLEQAQELAQAHREWLQPAETEFLTASVAAVEAAAAAREAQRQRELALEQEKAAAEQLRADAEKQRADAEQRRAAESARNARRLRIVAGSAVVIAVIAVGAVIFGWWQNQLVTARSLHTQAQLSMNDNNLIQAAVFAAHSEQFAPTIENSQFMAALPNRFIASARQMIGHTEDVWSVAWSNDGQLASGSSDGVVLIWETESGKVTQKLGGHFDEVNSVAWAMDGRLASGGCKQRIDFETCPSGEVVVWDPETWTIAQTLVGHTNSVRSIAWSQNGQLASGSEDGTVIIWNLSTGKPEMTLTGHTNWVMSVAWATDGRLASGSIDGSIRVWDINTGETIQYLTGHDDWVGSVSWSEDGRLASGSDDYTVKVWNPTTGDLLHTLKGQKAVRGVTWARDGRLFSESGDGTINVWDPKNEKLIYTLTGHVGPIRSIAWSQDGRLASGGSDGTVIVWNLANRETSQEFKGRSDAVENVTWLSDVKFASGYEDDTWIVWDTSISEAIQTINPLTSTAKSMALSANNQLAMGTWDGRVIVWDLEKGGQEKTFWGHAGRVNSVAWAKDGQLASGDSEGIVIIWDLEKGEPNQIMSGSMDYTETVVWSTDGRLASGGGCAIQNDLGRCIEGSIIIWNPQTGTQDVALSGHSTVINSLAWSRDGRLASGGNDGSVIVWNPDSGQILQTLNEHTRTVSNLAWSSTDLLASGSWDGKVIVWDLDHGTPALVLTGNTEPVLSVDWAEDGRVASGLSDGTVIFTPGWMNGPKCGWIPRNMTVEEWIQNVGVGFVYMPVCPELAQPEIVPWRAGWTIEDFQREGYLYFLITWPGRFLLMGGIALLLVGIGLVVWLPIRFWRRRRSLSPAKNALRDSDF